MCSKILNFIYLLAIGNYKVKTVLVDRGCPRVDFNLLCLRLIPLEYYFVQFSHNITNVGEEFLLLLFDM